MLSVGRIARTSAATTVAAAAILWGAAPAFADPAPGAGSCDDFFCVGVKIPGKKGGQGGSKGGSGSVKDKPKDTSGSDKSDAKPECTYEPMNPQPPADSFFWGEHDPSEGGALYTSTCTDFVSYVYFGPEGPPGGAVVVDPAVLAQEALDKMLLRPPAIGITPKPGGMGLVGMPVYLWTERGPETYGPNVASASAGGVTVTATAKVSKIVWEMGDGKTVTCTTPGTPYKAAYGTNPSPDCGHRYTKPSVAGAGTYHVVATSTWTIDWQATTGQSGQMTETRQSSVDIRVGELQAVGS
ncbi:ATP/GTP-binding protein [Streptomyces cinereoruber]|uniref:ATP/GTP-binding protein n=1 Tax=Streptomyces cinereoruber TaxID=67260 RepID=UPI0036D16F59